MSVKVRLLLVAVLSALMAGAAFAAISGAVGSDPTPARVTPSYVTSLPDNPTNGQEIFYQAAQGVVWRLRYRSASPSDYKWEFLGGPALKVEGVGGRSYNTWESTSSVNYTTLTTPGPAVTVPLSGEYDVTGYAQARQNTNGNGAGILIWKTGDGSPTWSTADSQIVTLGNYSGSLSARRTLTMAGGDTTELRYASSQATSSAQFYNRSLYVTPVRVK